MGTRLAGQLALRPVLAHVVDDRPRFPYVEGRMAVRRQEVSARRGSALPERLARDAEREGRLAIGEPAAALLQVADEVDADLLAVGSRGRGRVRSLLGSVSRTLVSHGGRPVMVVSEAAADRVLSGEVHGCPAR